jgi:hypothetical protein
MLTEKDYCDYDTCVALKELGYKVPTSTYYMPHHKDLIWVSNPFRGGYVIDCFYSHNSLPKDVMTANFIDAPTLWEAQKWLREEKEIFVYIDVPWKTDGGLGWSYFCCNKPMTEEDKEVCFASGGFYDSYEEALAEGIKQSVKILKEK